MDDAELRTILTKLLDHIDGKDARDPMMMKRLDQMTEVLKDMEVILKDMEERLKKVEAESHVQVTELDLIKRIENVKKLLPYEPYCVGISPLHRIGRNTAQHGLGDLKLC